MGPKVTSKVRLTEFTLKTARIGIKRGCSNVGALNTRRENYIAPERAIVSNDQPKTPGLSSPGLVPEPTVATRWGRSDCGGPGCRNNLADKQRNWWRDESRRGPAGRGRSSNRHASWRRTRLHGSGGAGITRERSAHSAPTAGKRRRKRRQPRHRSRRSGLKNIWPPSSWIQPLTLTLAHAITLFPVFFRRKTYQPRRRGGTSI